MSVTLLAISFFGTVFFLSFNIVLPERSLIDIISLYWDIILLYMVSGGWGWGKGECGCTEICTSAALLKKQSLEAIGFHGPLFLVFN